MCRILPKNARQLDRAVAKFRNDLKTVPEGFPDSQQCQGAEAREAPNLEALILAEARGRGVTPRLAPAPLPTLWEAQTGSDRFSCAVSLLTALPVQRAGERSTRRGSRTMDRKRTFLVVPDGQAQAEPARRGQHSVLALLNNLKRGRHSTSRIVSLRMTGQGTRAGIHSH
jgi:hypothetical protein